MLGHMQPCQAACRPHLPFHNQPTALTAATGYCRPALSTGIGLRPPQQRAGRSTLLALKAQAGGDIENIQLQVSFPRNFTNPHRLWCCTIFLQGVTLWRTRIAHPDLSSIGLLDDGANPATRPQLSHTSSSLSLSLYPSISLQVETGLIIGLPEATQEDIEELMAILTVATRSLSRKVCPP